MCKLREKVHPFSLPRLCTGRQYLYGTVLTIAPLEIGINSFLLAFPKECPSILVMSHIPRVWENSSGFSNLLEFLHTELIKEVRLDIVRGEAIDSCMVDEVFYHYDIIIAFTNDIPAPMLSLAKTNATVIMSANPVCYDRECAVWRTPYGRPGAIGYPPISIEHTSRGYVNGNTLIRPQPGDPLNLFRRYDE